MKLAIFIAMLMLFFPMPIKAQDPVPDPTPVVQETKPLRYFVGATDSDKQFIDAAIAAVDKSDLTRIQKWRVKRRLHKKRFVEEAKKEVRAELFWNDPEAMQNAEIDWSTVDWKAIVTVVLTLIKIFA